MHSLSCKFLFPSRPAHRPALTRPAALPRTAALANLDGEPISPLVALPRPGLDARAALVRGDAVGTRVLVAAGEYGAAELDETEPRRSRADAAAALCAAGARYDFRAVNEGEESEKGESAFQRCTIGEWLCGF